MKTAKELIAELRPTMPEEVLRLWALDAKAALELATTPTPKTQDGEAREALAVTKQTVWHKDQFYVTVDTVANEFVTISEELLVKLMTESGWVLVPSDPATPVFEAMGLPPVPPFPSIHPEGGE